MIYQTKLFPAITLYQSRAHHWNKFSEVGNQRDKRGWVIYVSRFSYWKLFWAVGGILPGLMICLPAMLANSPFLNLVISSPPNLVKDGQLICQINSNDLPSNLSSQLTLKGPVMISWPGCHLQFSHSPWTWSPTSIPTPTPTSTSISHQEKYRNCICFYKSHLFRTRLNCRNSLNAALSLLQVMIMRAKQFIAATLWYFVTFLLIELFYLHCFHWNRWNPSVKCCMNWNMAGLQFM